MGIYIFELQSKISYSLLSNFPYKISSDQNTVKRLETGRKSALKGGGLCSSIQGSGMEDWVCGPAGYSVRGAMVSTMTYRSRDSRGICNQYFKGKSSSSCYQASTYSFLDTQFTYFLSPCCMISTMPSPGDTDWISVRDMGLPGSPLCVWYLPLPLVLTCLVHRNTCWTNELLNEISNTWSFLKRILHLVSDIKLRSSP